MNEEHRDEADRLRIRAETLESECHRLAERLDALTPLRHYLRDRDLLRLGRHAHSAIDALAHIRLVLAEFLEHVETK